MVKKFRKGEGSLLTNFHSFLSFNLDHGRYHTLWEADNRQAVNVEEAMICRARMIDLPDLRQLRPLFTEDMVSFTSPDWAGMDGMTRYAFFHTISFRAEEDGYHAYEVSTLGHTVLRIYTSLKDVCSGWSIAQYSSDFDCLNADLHDLYFKLVERSKHES